MSVHNFLANLQGALKRFTLTKTATATLTNEEVINNLVIYGNHASAAIAFTLPAAGAANDGCINFIVNQAAAVVTVVVTAGFGAGNDTLTLAAGEMALIFSNGSYWYELHNEPAA